VQGIEEKEPKGREEKGQKREKRWRGGGGMIYIHYK
jgi:hypothetical protein